VPIYEYQCDDCGSLTEAFQKMSDEPLTVCEKCGGPLHKVLHPVAIHFKGSGFYTTDYGKGSGRRAGARDASSDSASGDSASGDASPGDGGSSDSGSKPAPDEGKAKEKQKSS
jgi:putative FmdB family regulatory protein